MLAVFSDIVIIKKALTFGEMIRSTSFDWVEVIGHLIRVLAIGSRKSYMYLQL